MRTRLLIGLTLTAASIVMPASAVAAEFVPGEVIVKYKGSSSPAARVDAQQDAGAGRPEPIADRTRELAILDGESVPETVAELNEDPSVAYAVPNYVAHASELVPNDRGFGPPGDWRSVQWNFLADSGVNAPAAWETAAALGAPGGRGATVAVLDTGVAYENYGRHRRAQDLRGTRFVRGYDFVNGDSHANDLNGHGTHVTGTIAQTTNNGRGVTGLAYGATIMPIRVLDKYGGGDAAAIARAIRFAANRGADVINMSLEFDSRVRASYIPDVLGAIRYANRRGVVVVGAAGNQAGSTRCGTTCPVAYPAANGMVIAVGGVTHRQCLAGYSNTGPQLDLVAPGGGRDARPGDNPRDQQSCRPDQGGRFIFQETFTRPNQRRFSLVSGYEGTSMAAPHVSATAALLIGSGRLGRDPSPADVERRIEETARDLGTDGVDDRYGAGLLDAAAALAP